MSALIEVDYNFFETKEESEKRCLFQKVKELEDKMERQRRCLFAKDGSKTKRMDDLESRMEIIERNLCRT